MHPMHPTNPTNPTNPIHPNKDKTYYTYKKLNIIDHPANDVTGVKPMNNRALIDIARSLVADNKGLLAMDESQPTCDKRFAALGIPLTVEARRAYRELIITTPGLGESVSGAILFDETIRQQKRDGTPFVNALMSA